MWHYRPFCLELLQGSEALRPFRLWSALVYLQAGEMDQWVECLLCMCEGLVASPAFMYKQGTAVQPVIPAMGTQRTGFPEPTGYLVLCDIVTKTKWKVTEGAT